MEDLKYKHIFMMAGAILALGILLILLIGIGEGINEAINDKPVIKDSVLVICNIDTLSMEDYEKESLDRNKPMEVTLEVIPTGLRLYTPFGERNFQLHVKFDREIRDRQYPINITETTFYACHDSNFTEFDFEKHYRPNIGDAKITEFSVFYGSSLNYKHGTSNIESKRYVATFNRVENPKEVEFIEYWMFYK